MKYVASSADGKTLSRSDDGVEFSLLDGKYLFKLLFLLHTKKYRSTNKIAPLLDYLCPAMKKSVKTMRKGEIAELTVKPACKFDKHKIN